MPEISKELHCLMIKTAIDLCRERSEKRPVEDFTRGGWMLHYRFFNVMTLFQYLYQYLSDEETIDPNDPNEYCGMSGFNTPRMRSFPVGFQNGCIGRLHHELVNIMLAWTRTVSKGIRDIYREDIQDYVPWFIIRKICLLYHNNIKDYIKLIRNEDPYQPLILPGGRDQTREEVMHRHYTETMMVRADSSKERAIWINQITEKLFLKEGIPRSCSRYPHSYMAEMVRWRSTQSEFEEYWQTWWTTEIYSKISFNGWIKYGTQIQRNINIESPEDSPIPDQEPEPEPDQEPNPSDKSSIREIMSLIDEKKEDWNMEDGDYLKLADKLKTLFDSS